MAGGPGGVEVGRVKIRVVPDFSNFRNMIRAQMAKLGQEGAQYFDKGFSRDFDNVLAKNGKSGGKVLAKELSKAMRDGGGSQGTSISKVLTKTVSEGVRDGVDKATKDAPLDAEKLMGNRNRLVRRLSNDLERVLTKMEFNIGLAGFDDAVDRDALDRTEKRLRKMLGEITPDLDMTDFLDKANRLERELDYLTERAVVLDPRKRYEQRLGEWLAAEKRFTDLQQKEQERRFSTLMQKARNVADYFGKIKPTKEIIDDRVFVKQFKENLAGIKDQLKVRVPVTWDEKTDIDSLYARIEAL